MSKIAKPQPEFEEEPQFQVPSPARITRDHRAAVALETWVESAGDIRKVMAACEIKTEASARKLLAEAHEMFMSSLSASAEAAFVRQAMILQKIEALIFAEVAAGNLGAGLAGIKALERSAKLHGLDKAKEDDGVKTIVVDLRLPGHEDVVDGEVTETDVTPQIGGGL